jgi:hypothetical protein
MLPYLPPITKKIVWIKKVLISVGNNLLVVGSSNVDVPNGVLEDVFNVEGMPSICFLFIVLFKKGINLKLGT